MCQLGDNERKRMACTYLLRRPRVGKSRQNNNSHCGPRTMSGSGRAVLEQFDKATGEK